MSITIPLRADLEARLLRRYKRFLADVETPDGRELTVHCANPGSMKGCSTPGALVRCSTSNNPKRKLEHSLEMIRVGRSWVGLQPMHANRLAAAALGAGAIEGLEGYRDVRPEVGVLGGSRLDFMLDGHARKQAPAYVEVKSVTLEDEGIARFPDAVTSRGKRHMETLERLKREGARAVVLFVVQRVDCAYFEPADAIDPAYSEALREACKNGVEAIAVRARVRARGITLEDRLPIRL
ncbi:MAG: DNA/RNA nuclease SfsA [Myxococcota bacterium]|jgi:sugar fermentation stimulation protein A|nr:DNA/RNA nuclease SfsA [Myxococcota bacterium]